MTPSKVIWRAFSGLLICGLAACEIEPVTTVAAPIIPSQPANISIATADQDADVKASLEGVSDAPVQASANLQIETTDNSSLITKTNTDTPTPLDTAPIIASSETDIYNQYDEFTLNKAESADTSPSEITEIIDTVQSESETTSNSYPKSDTDSPLDSTLNSKIETAPETTGESISDNTTQIAALVQIPIVPPKPAVEPAKRLPVIAPRPEPARMVTKIPKAPPKPPAPPAQLQPASLVGLTGNSLVAEIGEADFVRLEGQMQIWQYKTGSCVTDFFLYPATDVTTAPTYLVTDWYSRARDFGGILDAKNCREELATRQAF